MAHGFIDGRRRWTRSLWLIAILHALAGCTTCTAGSGELTHEVLPFRDFDTLILDGGPTTHVRIDDEFSVVAAVDTKMFPLLHFEQTGRTLVMRRDGGGFLHRAPSRLEITMPRLASVTSDLPNVKIDELDGGTLRVEARRLSDIDLGGRLDSLELRVEGEVDATELVATEAAVILSGGKVELGVVTDSVAGSGHGKLGWKGSPSAVDVSPKVERIPETTDPRHVPGH